MQPFAQAVLANATNNNLAPTSSPIVTDPGRLAAISGANASKYAANLTESSATGMAGMGQNQADLHLNAIKGQIQQSQVRQEEAKRMVDPNNYRQVDNGKGGFDFYDPNGGKITAQAYSKVTGTAMDRILLHSTDPKDVAFRSDYNNLQDILTAAANKDQKALGEYYKNQPELEHMKPTDLINRFKAYYPGYFSSDTNVPRSTQDSGAFASEKAASGNNSLSTVGTGFN